MKALLVDDDALSRSALAGLLSAYDVFELIEAKDGDDAWTLLEGGLDPAICFCDARMPVLQRMKGLPVVLLSPASDRDAVVQAVELGALGYLLKPLQAAEARVQLEKIFRQTLDKLAEDPCSTMCRLNIGTDRLGAYLNAFGEQLAAARTELWPMLAAGDAAGARLRVDALHTGCMMLGLWQGASQLDLAREDTLDPDLLEQALVLVADAVLRQARRVRASALMNPNWTLAQP